MSYIKSRKEVKYINVDLEHFSSSFFCVFSSFFCFVFVLSSFLLFVFAWFRLHWLFLNCRFLCVSWLLGKLCLALMTFLWLFFFFFDVDKCSSYVNRIHHWFWICHLIYLIACDSSRHIQIRRKWWATEFGPTLGLIFSALHLPFKPIR